MAVRKTHKQFVVEMSKVNPKIEIIGRYINSNTPIETKCRVCGGFNSAVPSSLLRGHGCPYCANNKVLIGFNDFATKAPPELLSEWDTEKNLPNTPQSFLLKSHKPVNWKCNKCGNEWSMQICCRTEQNQGCPKCAKKKRVDTTIKNAISNGKKTLAQDHPNIAAEWHPSKNGRITPYDVLPNSTKKIWWHCSVCNSDYEAIIADRSRGKGCPYCANQKVKSGFNDLSTRYPEIAKDWHPTKNGSKKPSKTLPFSNKKAWWHCSVCDSDYEAIIADRSRGTGCPYCANQKVKPGFNDLLTRMPEVAKYWHPSKNGNLTASDVLPHSIRRKYWWYCEMCGHEWMETPDSRCYRKFCPNCAKALHTSFSEQAILYYLKEYFDDVISRDKSKGIEIDIFIPSISLGVEYDGVYYHSNQKRIVTDELKDKLCKDNGITLYRIREPGLPATHLANNILMSGFTSDDLNRVINILLSGLNKNPIADVEKDTSFIIAQYKSIFIENCLAVQSPDALEKWDYEKNYPLKPENVVPGSGIKMWWKCKNCGHEWRARIVDEVSRGYKCPNCIPPHAKKVYQYDKDGHYIGEYRSLLEASKMTGISMDVISKACNKKCKTAGGFIWSLVKDIQQ